MDGYVFKSGKNSDDIGWFPDAVLLDESSLHPGLGDSPEEIAEKLALAEEVELVIQLAKARKINAEYGKF